METHLPIDGEHGVLRYGEVAAQLVVPAVVRGDDGVQAVVPTGHLHDDERAVAHRGSAGLLFVDGGGDGAAEDGGHGRRRGDGYHAGLEELTPGNQHRIRLTPPGSPATRA